MSNELKRLLKQMEDLEHRIAEELDARRADLKYEIRRGRIVFEEETLKAHKALRKKLLRFLYDSGVIGLAIAPLMYSMILPLALLDLSLSVFQTVVFTYYRIPKVRRRDYIVIDRHRLGYLNYFEKLNCVYCGYANGLIAYQREVIARTEKHWCPIRHARSTKSVHSQYRDFFDYGDATAYRAGYTEAREHYEV